MNSRILVRLVLGAVLAAVLSTAAFAQYGGGNMGGGTGTPTNGVYAPPKGGYKSSTGIAIGAGAAAGVGLAYFMLHNRGSVVGCVEEVSGGTRLVNEKDNKTYALDAGNLDLKTGERVKLQGKRMKSSSGDPSFEAKKLVKDYGSCNQQAALTAPAHVHKKL